MSTPPQQDSKPSLLIAIFPLRGFYPGTTMGIPLKTQAAFHKLRLTPGVSVVKPESINWHDSSHWINEENGHNMNVPELDAYGDLFDDIGSTWDDYKRRLDPAHLGVFEKVCEESGYVSSERRFKCLPVAKEGGVMEAISARSAAVGGGEAGCTSTPAALSDGAKSRM